MVIPPATRETSIQQLFAAFRVGTLKLRMMDDGRDVLGFAENGGDVQSRLILISG